MQASEAKKLTTASRKKMWEKSSERVFDMIKDCAENGHSDMLLRSIDITIDLDIVYEELVKMGYACHNEPNSPIANLRISW